MSEFLDDLEALESRMTARGSSDDGLVGAARYEIERLHAALLDVMTGGNHIASLLGRKLGPGFPMRYPPTMNSLDVLELLGAGDAFDAWCCWAHIMRARDALAESR